MPKHPWGHAIRLAGPWEIAADCPLELTSYKAESNQIHWQRFIWPVPVERVCQLATAELLIRRRFHAPTGLNGQIVWIIFPNCWPLQRVELNGQPLLLKNHQGQLCVEIQELLQPENLLVISISIEEIQKRKSAATTTVLLIIAESAAAHREPG